MSKYSKFELLELVTELYNSGEEWQSDGSPQVVTDNLWSEIHGEAKSKIHWTELADMVWDSDKCGFTDHEQTIQKLNEFRKNNSMTDFFFRDPEPGQSTDPDDADTWGPANTDIDWSGFPYDYKVVEDNGGGLTLFVWDETGKLIYSHCGYEYGNISENLRQDIKALQDGDDPLMWDGNEVKDEYDDGDINPESDWNNICSSELGYQIIVDSGTAYPHRMGGNGLRAILGMRDFAAAEDMPEEVLI